MSASTAQCTRSDARFLLAALCVLCMRNHESSIMKRNVGANRWPIEKNEGKHSSGRSHLHPTPHTKSNDAKKSMRSGTALQKSSCTRLGQGFSGVSISSVCRMRGLNNVNGGEVADKPSELFPRLCLLPHYIPAKKNSSSRFSRLDLKC